MTAKDMMTELRKLFVETYDNQPVFELLVDADDDDDAIEGSLADNDAAAVALLRHFARENPDEYPQVAAATLEVLRIAYCTIIHRDNEEVTKN